MLVQVMRGSRGSNGGDDRGHVSRRSCGRRRGIGRQRLRGGGMYGHWRVGRKN